MNTVTPRLVYVGCGHHRMDGFLHVEKNIYKSKSGLPDILADICIHIPLADNSVDLVFSRGTLEHLRYRELINHLLECQRMLKVGGHIRLLVPNFEMWIKEYEQKIYRPDREYDPDLPNENYVDTFVANMYYHDHYYLHNFDTMSRALEKTGFTRIRECDPGETQVLAAHDALLKAETRRHDNVIIEAQKSGEMPSAKRFPLPYSKNPIKKVLEKYFNIKLTPFLRNGTMFPTLPWFKEKIVRLRQMRKSDGDYVSTYTEPSAKLLYEHKIDLRM